MVGVVLLLLGLLLVLRFRLGLGDDKAAKQTEARCRQTDSCTGRKRESRSMQVCGVEGIAVSQANMLCGAFESQQEIQADVLNLHLDASHETVSSSPW